MTFHLRLSKSILTLPSGSILLYLERHLLYLFFFFFLDAVDRCDHWIVALVRAVRNLQRLLGPSADLHSGIQRQPLVGNISKYPD
jgi:hypothetical protein